MSWQQEKYAHNDALNGLYWNDIVWQRIGEYLGCEGNFDGLEQNLSRLSGSESLRRWLNTAKPEFCAVIHPSLRDTHPQHHPVYSTKFVHSTQYWQSLCDYFVNFENPPFELHMTLWNRDASEFGFRSGIPIRSIFNIDIEYRNDDAPAQIVVDHNPCIAEVNKLRKSIEEVLLEYDFQFLSVGTGKGFQILAEEPHDSDVLGEMLEIAGTLEQSLLPFMRYVHLPHKKDKPVADITELLFVANQRLSQYVTLKAAKRAGCDIPITIMSTGDGAVVNIDNCKIFYDVRMASVAVTGVPYLKTTTDAPVKGFKEIMDNSKIPLRLPVGRDGIDYATLEQHLEEKFNYQKALKRLGQTPVRLPDCSVGMKKLISEYKQSELYKAHQAISGQDVSDDERWHSSPIEWDYVKSLSHELAHSIEEPNPYFMKSDKLIYTVNTLLDRGLHPQFVIGFLADVYKRPDFGIYFDLHCAERRARGVVEVIIGERLLEEGKI